MNRETAARVDAGHGVEQAVRVPAGRVTLDGTLVLPRGATGIVLFAHGSGRSRHSPRNRYIAQVLRDAGLATLLLDLLTEDEERVDEDQGQVDMVTGALRFNIPLLAKRLVDVTDWLTWHAATRHLTLGYFGAGTGSAAALMAARERRDIVAAIVSRGGRPDLARSALPCVRAPTLLIVGELDDMIIELNREAFAQLCGEKDLMIVPGATHLCEEPGTLERVALAAQQWFARYLTSRPRAGATGRAVSAGEHAPRQVPSKA